MSYLMILAAIAIRIGVPLAALLLLGTYLERQGSAGKRA